jgi:hypothetical protein
MRSIDIHAHLMPHGMLQTLYRGDTWHGVSGERNAQGRLVYGLGGRRQALTPQFAWNTAQRLADMDSLGVDMQVVSTFIGYYQPLVLVSCKPFGGYRTIQTTGAHFWACSRPTTPPPWSE